MYASEGDHPQYMNESNLNETRESASSAALQEDEEPKAGEHSDDEPDKVASKSLASRQESEPAIINFPDDEFEMFSGKESVATGTGSVKMESLAKGYVD